MSWGKRESTKWQMVWDGEVVGTSETVTVGQGITVGKLIGRDSWLDCLPYMGPEACLTWLVVLTAPRGEQALTTEEFITHMQRFVTMSLDDLFNTLILE